MKPLNRSKRLISHLGVEEHGGLFNCNFNFDCPGNEIGTDGFGRGHNYLPHPLPERADVEDKIVQDRMRGVI